MHPSNSKKVGEIFQTKDYSIFKFRNDNRDIIQSHVNNLSKSMLVDGWQDGSTAVVNQRFEVIDGQHRILAAQKANVSVRYEVVRNANLNTIRRLNTKTKNWNIITHLKSYVKEGNQNYILLDRFMKNFPTLRPTECMMLVKNSMSSAKREEFESGNFVVKDMKKAYEWGHRIMRLRSYFEKGYNKSIFVRALIEIFINKPKFNFDEFVHKIQIRPRSIYMCGTVSQYIEMIEDIYNYKRKVDEKVNLRF